MRERENVRLYRWLALSVLCALVVLGAALPARGAANQTPPPLPTLEGIELAPELAEPTLKRIELPLAGPVLVPPPAPKIPDLPAASTVISYGVDTEIWAAQPNSNYGQELPIYVGYRDHQPGRMLLEIPIWDLPPRATIHSAQLRFAVVGWRNPEHQTRTLTARRVTMPWHEWLATWNNAPAAAEVLGSVPVGTPQPLPLWHSIDLTDVVRGWHDGTYPNFGILISSQEGGDPAYQVIASSETTDYPRLEVTYTPAPPTLAAAPSALGLMAGDGHTTSQRLTISNDGSDPLDWQASPGASTWISLSQTSGTLHGGRSTTVEVSADTSGLGYGTHQGQVLVTTSTPGALGSPQNVGVTLYYVENLIPLYLPVTARSYPDPDPPRNAVALYIGIDDYLHAGPPPSSGARAGDWGSGDLFFAVDDVKAEAKQMAHLGFYDEVCSGTGATALQVTGAHPGNRLVLTDAEASFSGIEAAFRWLDAVEDEETLVLVAYSGHGGKLPDDNGDEDDGWDEFLATYDTDEVGGGLVNVIRDDLLDAWLSELESERVVVLLDSCFAAGMMDASALAAEGLFSRGLALPAAPGAGAGDASNGMVFDIGGSGRTILAASAPDQASVESGALGHGVFSYYFLMALMDPATDITGIGGVSADTNGNGRVSVEEAFAYLAPKVDDFVWEASGGTFHQNPQISDGIPGPVELTCCP
jgi:hypothetical protein